jgi:hypothetical protein
MEIQDSDPTSQTSCLGETSPAETRRSRSSAPIGPAACPSAPTIQYCFTGGSLGSSAREVGAPSNCEWQLTRCSPQPGRSPTASPLTSAVPRANREGSRGRADWGSLPPPLRGSPSRAGRSGPDEVQERSRWLGNGSENPAPPRVVARTAVEPGNPIRPRFRRFATGRGALASLLFVLVVLREPADRPLKRLLKQPQKTRLRTRLIPAYST